MTEKNSSSTGWLRSLGAITRRLNCWYAMRPRERIVVLAILLILLVGSISRFFYLNK